MAEPFVKLTGIAAPLRVNNVDTDQIIPSREMKTVGRTGLGDGLFAGWRYVAPTGRDADTDFVLNKPRYAGATILVSGENFGCGSSREHAVWALAEFGIRAVIAKSFGDIFYNNCTRNGILPIKLESDVVDHIAAHVEVSDAPELSIDLGAQTVSDGSVSYDFAIAPYPKRLLLEGLDPIGLTLLHRDKIKAFQTRDAEARRWVYD